MKSIRELSINNSIDFFNYPGMLCDQVSGRMGKAGLARPAGFEPTVF